MLEDLQDARNFKLDFGERECPLLRSRISISGNDVTTNLINFIRLIPASKEENISVLNELAADSEGSLLHPVVLIIGRSHLLSSTCRESTSAKMKLIYNLEDFPSVPSLGDLTRKKFWMIWKATLGAYG